MSGYEATAIGLTRVSDVIGPQGISLAEKTVNNFITKALRLYEREAPTSYPQNKLCHFTVNGRVLLNIVV